MGLIQPGGVALRYRIVAATLALIFMVGVLPAILPEVSAAACDAPANPIMAENCLPGNPPSEWDVSGAGDGSIQGFATDISYNRGETARFKIKTTASNYRLDIYRMGYYGGQGARKVATVTPSASLPQNQPNCLTQSSTGLVDCGNWAVSASWPIPATATSGIYFARLVRADNGGASHVVFIVRDDSSTSNLFFQTSDTTWQAYNSYGGNSLYIGSPAGRAYKVSYNRPFNTRSVDGGQDWVFHAEYPMVRWLEANGYDVSYTTGVDSDRRGALIRNHRVFLSVGHDEYWSAGQRANVEAARDAGVHLAFFSGNEVFWKTRWETSIDSTGTPYRTLVSYKETHDGAKTDPDPAWTGTWRDPRFSPPSDGGRPENALTGTIFTVNAGATTSIQVPAADGKMRFWRNTSIANLPSGETATLPYGTLGYEWDEDLDNGFRPAGLIRLSKTTVPNAPVLQDYGSTYGSGAATHALTLYRHNSGALVFGAGTIQWSWGLDSTHDNGSAPADVRMQQATVNLFADMGTQPATLQAGLVAATSSTDTTAPTSTIESPITGSTVPASSTITISGTAIDSGGGIVGGVEVSVDSGTTWRPAVGRASWSYTWTTASTSSTVTIKSRAIDDTGNIQPLPTEVAVTVGGAPSGACPCSLWPSSATPALASDPDTSPIELGVKFRSEVDGYITGIRFYKGSGNTGTHTGSLWSSGGVRLASATFTSETETGWQQVSFASPVAITATTTYIASYFAPNGRYAITENGLATAVDNAPLQALASGASGGNGVYRYGGSGFPTDTYNATNYWVDVVFTTSTGPDTTPPDTTITAGPSGTVTSTSASFSFTASEANSAFACSLDGGPFTACASPTSYSNLAAGRHTFQARATDPAGNPDPSPAERTWTIDLNQPPTAVASATPTSGAAPLTVSFDGSGSSDPEGDALTYAWDLDGDGAYTDATTAQPSFTYTAAGSHTARLRVTDGKGAMGTSSPLTIMVSAPSDTTAPTVTSVSPTSGATDVSASANVTATFSEALDPATITTNTVELRDGSGSLVAASVSYDGASRTATLNPGADLAASTTYTATIKGGGSGVKDLAGNPLAGDYPWSFTTVASSSSSALRFDGVNDYVAVPDSASLRLTTLTLEAWVKVTSVSGHRHIAGKNYYELSAEPSGAGVKFLFEFRTSGGWRSVESGTFALNEWHHVAGSYNGSVMTLYVNGVQVATRTTSGTINQTTRPFRIGSADASRDFFAGLIDEVRLSNVVRYTGATYPVPGTAFVADANTIGLWHFDEGTGTTTADASGNGHTGTLTNGPVWRTDSPLIEG